MGGAGENCLRQRLNKGRLCVLHSGQVYDVTDFSDRHPGGREWLERYAGKDVTEVMQQLSPHIHTKAAYSILRKYRVVEAEEGDHKLSGDPNSYQSRQFHSMQDDPLVDWSQPIMSQIPGLRENYYKWVHEPVDTSLRLFHSDLVEFFSKCPWYMVPIVWVPITLLMLLKSYSSLSLASHDPVIWNLFGTELSMSPLFILPLVLFGLMLWTFCEYIIHRWLFHMKPPANVPILVLLHFILHGQHHKSPMDRMRLVFPTVPASIFASLIFGLYCCLAPLAVAQALFSGTLMGYMVYDLTHYYIHHGAPMTRYFRSLKQYHVKHHFEQQNLGFGISSKLWDYPFGTLIPTSE